MVSRWSHNPEIVGSIPTHATKESKMNELPVPELIYEKIESWLLTYNYDSYRDYRNSPEYKRNLMFEKFEESER